MSCLSGMTTKLQSHISPLNRGSHTSTIALSFHQSCLQQEAGSCKVAYTMDRTHELQKIESVRRTMLMHEEIFKHQVQELHRLYNRQKNLMHELENRATQKKDSVPSMNNALFPVLNNHQETNFFPIFSARDDPREMSGSCSGESSRMPLRFDIERPSEATTSSMHVIEEQKELGRTDEEPEVEVELTLSIGHCTRKKKPKSLLSGLNNFDQANTVKELCASSTKVPDGEDCGEHSSIVTSASVPLYQEDTRPRWLLQDLSLNKT